MKTHHILIIYIILFFATQNCVVRYSTEVKNNFTNRFKNEDTKLSELINTDGVYELWHREKLHSGYGKTYFTVDSTYNLLLFFKNGICAQNFFFKGKDSISDCKNNLDKSVRRDEEGNFFAPYFGIYRLQGDTIILQYLGYHSRMTPFILFEEWFKIIDRTTLQYIYLKPLLKEDAYLEKNIEEWQKENLKKYSLLKFIKADSLPSSDCWLKKEKWIWENEEEWEAYMKRKGFDIGKRRKRSR